ncbi:MAG: hypothetical protein KKH74_11055 [Gammaproteobacteria bacterium]|nr:hypothetical protein [Gammaproteobacteria bacterium]MBU1731467.1 hypothetical protein [Gammaproteobacteria bacterium]MBU1892972.1 hypothetical protein [Gammaproteobacteria bacterium]
MDTPFYKNATCWTYYSSQEAAERMPCEVRINEESGEIAISYESEDGYTVYSGNESGDGHYVLECEEVQGRASLHRFPSSSILEGYWEENGLKGMWRIELGEISDTVTGDEIQDSADEGEGTADELDRLIAGEDEDDWGPRRNRYRFPLREDETVSFRIPEDITRKEVRRLAGFILSLSWT